MNLFDCGNAKNLEDVYREINECENCRLWKYRKIEYHWRGNPKSKIMFIGEALGAEEQRLGSPFVGRSGKKLDKLFNNTGLDIEKDAYITNIVKDRPPDNRNPFSDEIKACQVFLLKEIHFIKPKLIITLGRVPSNWWSRRKPYEWFTHYPERRWFPMWHPSYLLRSPSNVGKWQIELKRILAKLNF